MLIIGFILILIMNKKENKIYKSGLYYIAIMSIGNNNIYNFKNFIARNNNCNKNQISRMLSKKIIKRFYNISNINFMFLKKILKDSGSYNIRNYSVNIKKNKNLKNNKENHPRNVEAFKGNDLDKVYITDINYSHSNKLDNLLIGSDKKNNNIYYIRNKGEIITLKNQNDANNFASNLEQNYKDYNVTLNDKKIYNITNKYNLEFLKLEEEKINNVISLTNKDIQLNEFINLLRNGNLFKEKEIIKFLDNVNKND